jgi:hypothetical protein
MKKKDFFAYFQATIASLQAQVNSGPTDPHLLQELDQLRNIRSVITSYRSASATGARSAQEHQVSNHILQIRICYRR